MDPKLALVLLAATVVVSGCMHGGSQTPEEQLQSAFDRADSSNYHVTYEMSLGGGEMSQMFSEMIGDLELYSHDGRTKTVVSTSIFGSSSVTATYDFDNVSIECTEGGGSILDSSSSLECSLDSSSLSSTSQLTGEEYEDDLDNINVSRDGTMNVAGRTCDRFVLNIPSDELNSSYADTDVDMGICMDQGKGYPAFIRMNTSTDSELQGSTTSTVLTMEAQSYSGDVSFSDVEVPRSVVAEARCSPEFEVETYSVDYSGDATVSVNGENRTVLLTEGEKKTVPLSEDNKVSGDNTVKIYTGEGKPATTSCYDYGLDYDYDYDYNFSDY